MSRKKSSLERLLAGLFFKTKKNPPHGRKRKLGIESLEAREMLSGIGFVSVHHPSDPDETIVVQDLLPGAPDVPETENSSVEAPPVVLNAVTSAVPSLTALGQTSTYVKLAWGAVSGATRYEVLRKNANGSWTTLQSNLATAAYNDTAAPSDATTYKINIYNGTTVTHSSEILSLGLTRVVAQTDTCQSVQLSWSPVSGATHYGVWWWSAAQNKWMDLDEQHHVERYDEYNEQNPAPGVSLYSMPIFVAGGPNSWNDHAIPSHAAYPYVEIYSYAGRDIDGRDGPAVPGYLAGMSFSPPSAVDGVTPIYPEDPEACFAAGTTVLMADRSMKAIEQIMVGDRVLARNDKNPDAPLQERTVLEIKHNAPSATYWLAFRSEINGEEMTLRVAPEHPFYTASRGWRSMENLEPGDFCIGPNGERSVLLSKRFDAELIPVYNLEVEEDHTYFVGPMPESCVLVHNEYGTPKLEKPRPPFQEEWRNIVDRIHRDAATGVVSRAIAKRTATMPNPLLQSRSKLH